MRSPTAKLIACAVALTASAVAMPAGALALRPVTIPALREWHGRPGSYRLPPRPRIIVAYGDRRALKADAIQLAEDLRLQTGRRAVIRIRRRLHARAGDIVLRTLRDPALGAEGYVLSVTSRRVSVAAPDAAGVFYGGRTILQLLRAAAVPGAGSEGDAGGVARIPAGVARDWPRYPERGLMVDAGRKYYTPRWLLGELREMAYLKLNYLHLHLSDNQGFRIESRTHPEIVSPAHLSYGDVRRILALAHSLHITVVPELDMPGHMQAALIAHPELQLADATGNRDMAVLDVSKPAATRFASDLIGEYLGLFDGPFWHLGADEVIPFAEYRAGRYPQLQTYARARFGPDANAKDAVQAFVNDMDGFVRARGRTARMWHDDVGGGSAVRRRSDIVTEWWIDYSPLSDLRPPTPQQLIDAGHEIVNAGWFPTYVVNGVGGSIEKIRPNLTAAYESWEPFQFYGILVADSTVKEPPATVSPMEPKNLGTILHLWNDNPALTTEAQDVSEIEMLLRVIAQKTWGSSQLTGAYADFAPLAAALGTGPGDDRIRDAS